MEFTERSRRVCNGNPASFPQREFNKVDNVDEFGSTQLAGTGEGL